MKFVVADELLYGREDRPLKINPERVKALAEALKNWNQEPLRCVTAEELEVLCSAPRKVDPEWVKAVAEALKNWKSEPVA